MSESLPFEHKPLVPLADRAYPPPSSEEDTEQQTIWHNPTGKTAKLELFIETPKPGRPPRTYDERHGTHTYFLKAGETRALPSRFDRQIQQTQCYHTDCLQRPFDCRSNEDGHEKQVVGGFGPQLENRGTQRAPIRAGFIQLAPALDDAEARRKAAETEEFENWRRQKMAEERNTRAAEERLKAEKEIREREERAAWAAKRDQEAAAAASKVDQEKAAADRDKQQHRK